MTREELIEKLKTQMDTEYPYWGDVTAEYIVELLEEVGLEAEFTTKVKYDDNR